MSDQLQQRVVRHDGRIGLHREKPSRLLGPVVFEGEDDLGRHWRNDVYYGTLRRYDSGFPIGGGPWAIIGITALAEDARHDWREFQQIKNALVGDEWEAVELYPAESRLTDPSNRFYLWCAPKGVFAFGFDHRRVWDIDEAKAPQRPLPRNS